MGLLIDKVVRWIYRHFLTLLLILAVLVTGRYLQNAFEEYRATDAELTHLKDGKQQLDKFLQNFEAETAKRISSFSQSTSAELAARIAAIDLEIKQKQSAKQQLGNLIEMLAKRPLGRGYIDSAILGFEIDVLQEERKYLDYLLTMASGTNELEAIRLQHLAAYAALQKNNSLQEQLKQAYPVQVHIPGTSAYTSMHRLEATYKILLADNQRAYDSYRRTKEWLDTKLATRVQFTFHREAFANELQHIDREISERGSRLVKSWFGKILQACLDALPMALAVLLSIILVPIGIKAVFFFVLAPLASRRPPIILSPDSSGLIDEVMRNSQSKFDRAKISSVSVPMQLDEHQELLVHPEYLQSSAITGKKDTKWLMDYAYPWSSLLSGMFALTRIRADQLETVVLSAGQDPMSEVGVISLPAGSAVVMHPRALIGVAYEKAHPVRITRHWRLFSAHAWLTLQLRYLVFHGPSKLVLKGCRGVRVESAGNGRRINQMATLGFSANLKYSTARCETFLPYLTGKQDLLNDCFAGDAGYYIYEETPHHGRHAGITGRGLKGFADSVLKVFGI